MLPLAQGGSMKIAIKEDGPFLYVDTIEEAVEVLKKLSEVQEPKKREIDIVAEMANETERVRAFFSSINPNARKLLANLIPFREGIRSVTFEQITGFSRDKFGGFMGGMEKLADKQKLKREQFMISEMRTEGTERVRYFQPGKMLVKYELELRKLMKKEDASVGETISMGA
jgi:hypothetical protein